MNCSTMTTVLYVDQWDWELAITEEQRNLKLLREVVQKIWKVIKDAEIHVQNLFPKLKTNKYPIYQKK
jgi:aspartate--ammonia ligase